MTLSSKMCDNWKRPESVPFPSVWRKFEGKKVINGAKRHYWIQDLSEEYYEKCLNLMCYKFVLDEPLCKYANVKDDPEAIKEFRQIWKEILKHKLALLCLTKDVDGGTKIAGINMTGRSCKYDEDTIKMTSIGARKVFETMAHLNSLRDVYSELNVDSYLTALGLFVLPEYRGEDIGLEMLKSRRELCQAVGIEASATAFTSIISQKLAVKAGFQDFAEIPYDDLEKANPFLAFPGITSFTKTLKHMVIVYD